MEFSLILALFAGLMATVVMSLFAEGASLKGATSMPSMSFMIGSAFSGDHDMAMVVGNFVHFFLLGTLLSGVGYGLALSVIGLNPFLVGLGLGWAEGALVGAGLGRIDMVHPRLVDPVPSSPGPARRVRPSAASETEVAAVKPGVFGVNWGDLTPIVLMAAYSVYGLTFAFVYSVFA